MKVALTSSSSPLKDGGAAESTRLISEGLRERGLEVDVFSTTGDKRKNVREREGVYKIPSGDTYPGPSRIGVNISTLRHIDLSRYDIVHAYGLACVPGMILKSKISRNSPPILGTANNLNWICTNWTRYLEQGCPDYGLKKIVEYSLAEGYRLQLPAKVGLEMVGKGLTKQGDYITTQTTGMKDIMMRCGYNGNQLEVVPNLLDDRFDISSDQPNRTVMFVGRLIERKGVVDIFDAFVDTEKTLSEEWELKIFGGGKLKPKLEKMAEKRDNVSVDYCPYVKLPEVYKEAAVLVHGSKYPEPFSRTWLEAMASETAIVASRNPSSEAVLSDCAELYDPFDKESLRDSLRSVLSNKEKRDRLREKGKMKVEEFRADKVVNAYVDIYERLLDGA